MNIDESGIAYQYNRIGYWLQLEKEAEEFQKWENECAKKYAEIIRKIYSNESMDIAQIPIPKRIQICDGSNDPKMHGG